jgi:hypothetical protein
MENDPRVRMEKQNHELRSLYKLRRRSVVAVGEVCDPRRPALVSTACKRKQELIDVNKSRHDFEVFIWIGSYQSSE